jgi:hypothetical protein
MAAAERREYKGTAPATTLSGGINNSTTTIPVTSGTGYPDGSVGPFFVVIDRGLASEEKVKCVSRSGNTITAVTTTGRGSDGTSATTHVSGAAVEHVLTADDLNLLNLHVADVATDNHTQYLTTTRHTAVTHIGGRDRDYWTNVGTTSWYLVGAGTQVGFQDLLAGGLNLQQDVAIPHLERRGGTIDRVAIVQAGVGAGTIRLGLHTCTSATNLYPDTLVTDFGSLSITGSGDTALTVTVNQALTADTLYYFSYNLSSGAGSVYRLTELVPGVLGVLGVDNTLTYGGMGWQVNRAHGAFAGTYPGSATLAGQVAAIWIRYSA